MVDIAVVILIWGMDIVASIYRRIESRTGRPLLVLWTLDRGIIAFEFRFILVGIDSISN